MHWSMEAQVDLPWGFWSLAGQQAPFASLTLVKGRWPKGRQEWLDKVRRKHGLSMLHAEAQDGYWLADPALDVHGDWKEIRAKLARAYAFEDSPLAAFGPQDVERLRPFAQRAVAAWDALPAGGSLEVRWPGANELVVVSTEERSLLALGDDAPLGLSHFHQTKPDGTREAVSVALASRRVVRSRHGAHRRS